MSDYKVRAALVEAYLEAMSPTPPPTEYENVKFTVPNSTNLWISLKLMPVSSRPATLGLGGEDEDKGLLQIDINVPEGTSDKTLILTADILKSFFTAGRSFTYNGVTVTITSRVLSKGRHADSWWRRSLTVSYYTRINR